MSDDFNPEEILERTGGFGRFQVVLCLIMQLMKIPTVFGVWLTVFAVARPDWWCVDAGVGYNMSTATTEGAYPRTRNAAAAIDDDQSRFKSCQNQNGSTCSTFIYDESMHTIVSEWDMACELSWIPSMIASLQFAGLLTGHLVCGQLADTIGRKKPLFLSLVIIIGSSLIGYFATSWVTFAVGRVFCGFGAGCFLTVHYSVVIETSLARMRPWIVGLPSWPLEICLFSFVAYLVPDWRKMHMVLILVTAPFFAAWWFIPDSFRWYLSHERKDDARKVIQFIAKFNTHDVSDDVTDAMLSDLARADMGGDHRTYTVAHMFKTRRLTKITLISTIIWFAMGLVCYCITFGIEALSGNFYLNQFIFNIITVPAYFVAIWMCNRFGRRESVILCFAITAVGCAVVGTMQSIDLGTRDTWTNAFAVLAFIGATTAWVPVSTMTQELYPTVIRNIAYGFMNVFVRIGAMIAPQLSFFNEKVAGLMYFLCAFISVLCVGGTYALAETRGRDLTDKINRTVVDAHARNDQTVTRLRLVNTDYKPTSNSDNA